MARFARRTAHLQRANCDERLVINAIKVIPKLIALKPKPSIGLAGPFPTFSLAFELEADSITLYELFKDLKGRAHIGGR